MTTRRWLMFNATDADELAQFSSSAEYLDGGMSWPRVDCLGYVFAVKEKMGTPLDLNGQEIDKDIVSMFKLGLLKPSNIVHGAVAIMYRNGTLEHVGVVVQVDHMRKIWEFTSTCGVKVSSIPAVRRRFDKVEFVI